MNYPPQIWSIVRADGTVEPIDKPDFIYDDEGWCVGIEFPEGVTLAEGDTLRSTSTVTTY